MYKYKVFDNSVIDLSKSINVFIGENMIGKSEVLKSFYNAEKYLNKKFWGKSEDASLFLKMAKKYRNPIINGLKKCVNKNQKIDLTSEISREFVEKMDSSVEKSVSQYLENRSLLDLKMIFVKSDFKFYSLELEPGLKSSFHNEQEDMVNFSLLVDGKGR